MALTPVILNPGVGGSQIQTDNIGGDSYEVVKVAFGSEGTATMVDAANPLPVLASIDTTGLATSANQSTEIAALASIAAEDFATADLQTTGNNSLASIDGKLTNPLPVSATDLDIRNLVFATDKADVSGSTGVGVTGTFFQATQPVSAAALPLPSGAATSALQTQPGVDIGDVTVNNAAGASAVNIQDGGNSITVDGTVAVTGAGDATAAKQDAQTALLTTIDGYTGNISTKIDTVAGAVSGSEMQVDVITMPTVTVQATDLDIRNLVFATDKVDASGTILGAGTNNIGDVDVLSLPALPAGTNNIGDVDVASIAAGDNNIGNVDIVTLPALVAGSAIIGNVRIDQTTPGTTNAVQANAGTNLNTNALNLEATQSDIRTALQIMDDWDESDRAKVNLIVGQAGVAGGTGTDGATVQRVTLATNVGLPAGTAVIGKTGIDQTTPGTTNLVALSAETTKVIGTVNQAIVARSARIINLDSYAVAATAETLITMSYSTDNGTLTTGTSYAVTSGKILRIQSIIGSLHVITGNTTSTNVIVRIRVNNAGAGIVSSPVQMIATFGGATTANNSGAIFSCPIPDGWEFVAGAGIAVTIACAGFVTTTAAPKVNINIIGYEY